MQYFTVQRSKMGHLHFVSCAVVLFLLAVWAPVAEAQSCPPEWITFGQSCFYFSPLLLTWRQARHHCQNKRGDLAMLKTREVALRLAEQRHVGISPYFFWIGLVDFSSEGTFHWVDGTPLTYSNWFLGEPNNQTQEQEHCAQMFSYRSHGWQNGKWTSEHCDTSFNFICEINLAPPTPPPPPPLLPETPPTTTPPTTAPPTTTPPTTTQPTTTSPATTPKTIPPPMGATKAAAPVATTNKEIKQKATTVWAIFLKATYPQPDKEKAATHETSTLQKTTPESSEPKTTPKATETQTTVPSEDKTQTVAKPLVLGLRQSGVISKFIRPPFYNPRIISELQRRYQGNKSKLSTLSGTPTTATSHTTMPQESAEKWDTQYKATMPPAEDKLQTNQPATKQLLQTTQKPNFPKESSPTTDTLWSDDEPSVSSQTSKLPTLLSQKTTPLPATKPGFTKPTAQTQASEKDLISTSAPAKSTAAARFPSKPDVSIVTSTSSDGVTFEGGPWFASVTPGGKSTPPKSTPTKTVTEGPLGAVPTPTSTGKEAPTVSDSAIAGICLGTMAILLLPVAIGFLTHRHKMRRRVSNLSLPQS